MGLKFNPLTGQFDLVGSSGGGGGGIVIGDPITGANPSAVLITDSTGALADSGTLSDGQIVIGDTGGSPVAGSLAGTSGEIIVTPGPGSLTISLDPDVQNEIDGKANVSLDNLASTAVNVNILPGAANTIDLGSSSLFWNDVYTTNTRTDVISTRLGTGTIGFLNELDLGNQKATNMALPTNGNDATNKNYVDNADALLIPLTQKGAANGVATLDGAGKVPVSQLPNAVMTYEGFWDASTNTPTLVDGSGDAGMVYLVSVAGTQDLGSGSQSYNIGDYVIYSGSIWQKSDNTESVVSVNGQTGIVVLDAVDIDYDNTTSNLVATDVQAAIDEISDVIHTGDVQAIYVDASEGNDTTGTGSFLYPVATIDKAVTLVTVPSASYVIKVGPGIYTGALISWPPNADLIGSGSNSTQIQNSIEYVAAISSESNFTMSMVSINDITLDFTNADIALPTFFDGTFSITRLDTNTVGPFAIRINDSTLGNCIFRGNNVISNCLFQSGLTIEEDGLLLATDTVLGIPVSLVGNAILNVTGCNVSNTLTGTTVGPNTPTLFTDASSSVNATFVNVNVSLIDKAEFIGYDNSTSGLTAINVQDAIDEVKTLTNSWQKYTISHSALQAAAITNSITLFTMTDRIIEGIVVAHSTAASGGTIASYNLTIGIAGEEDRFATPYDAFVAPTSTNHSIYHILDIPERGTAVNVLLTATSTGDNLDQSVAGTFIIYVKTSSIE